MTEITERARALLADQGISDYGDKLQRFAERCVEAAHEALDRDPDISETEAAGEEADALAAGADTLAFMQSRSFMHYEPDLEPRDASIEARAEVAAYELASNMISAEIMEARPADALDWSNAEGCAGEVLVGRTEGEGFVYVKVELRQRGHGEELSITGSTRYSAGQIDGHLRADDFEPAPGWTREDLERLWAIWDRWHLNDMNAHCEHQRAIADKLGKKPHEVFTTRNATAHYSAANSVHPSIPHYMERYGGKLHGMQASNARVQCPICGYDYGSAWRRETLPEDVRAWLVARFPNAVQEEERCSRSPRRN